MKKILIANRGEIAVRVIRACRELGIRSVAVHSTADRESLHTKLADESICIGPGPSRDSYLSIPRMMCAAEIAAVDAVHPGYGFLSENAEFARVCQRYGIKFIGPTPEQIEGLGDKVLARASAIRAGIALLPGSRGVIGSVAEAFELAEQIGYPLIIKASAGGGGRGMKIVHRKQELAAQLSLARSEAAAAFGHPDCFIERYLEAPRHVEVQLVADQHGTIVVLGERDCSVQRHHQKLIEEAPCSALSEEERQRVGQSAVILAQSVGYESLGTAEFLYQDGQFYFMEMNTRVQVEHPVTEMVTDVDLVKTQIAIACGERLSAELKPSRGHSIECRVNAEDPKTYAPWPGLVTGYHQPGGPGVRVDSCLYANYRVPAYYDSMVAKVITFGSDREEARVRMLRALGEMRIDGIRTNIPLHLEVLRHEAFVRGELSTHFLAQLKATPPVAL